MPVVDKNKLTSVGKASSRLVSKATVTTAKIAWSAFNQASSYFLERKYLKKWPNKYISPEERQKLREIYFNVRGYDFAIPENSQNRGELALSLLQKEKPDFDAALMLFDPEFDADNVEWLYFMHHYFSNSNNPLYDSERAQSYKAQMYQISDGPDFTSENSFYRMRMKNRIREYFEYHDLGEPPISDSDRLSKCVDFIDSVPGQLNHAYALYDPHIDNKDASWLLEVGFIHDLHMNNDDLFDPVRAEEFFRQSAKLGNSTAAFNLGVKYHGGKEEDSIDLDEALKWYRHADQLGDQSAKHRIAQILTFQRDLEKPDANDKYTDEIVELYRQGC